MRHDDERNTQREPEARNVDWPDLVAKCERRGVPVLRLDEHGAQHIIRTSTQLLSEWEQ